jgi:hypothetical protein
MSAAPEAFIPLNGSAGNSAPVGLGGRRGSRKLKLVTRKQARSMLKKLGRKMRGGVDTDPAAVVVDDKAKGDTAVMGGRKRSGTKKTRRGRKGRSLFGMKY